MRNDASARQVRNDARVRNDVSARQVRHDASARQVRNEKYRKQASEQANNQNIIKVITGEVKSEEDTAGEKQVRVEN